MSKICFRHKRRQISTEIACCTCSSSTMPHSVYTMRQLFWDLEEKKSRLSRAEKCLEKSQNLAKTRRSGVAEKSFFFHNFSSVPKVTETTWNYGKYPHLPTYNATFSTKMLILKLGVCIICGYICISVGMLKNTTFVV